MYRILIIGPSGAGKSTLARAVGKRLAIPVVHLDAINWGPGWVQRNEAEIRGQIAGWSAQDAWVMDGNYLGHIDLRLPRATAVVWLDLPRHVYFSRAVYRSITQVGRLRDDVGNLERCELEFFTGWVWTYPKRRPRDEALMADLPEGVTGIVLRSSRDVSLFEQALPQSLCAGTGTFDGGSRSGYC